MFSFEFVEVPAMTCLVRRAACRHDELGHTIGRLVHEIIEANPDAVMQGPPMIRYLKWEPETCEIEAAVWVEDGTRPGQGSELKVLPGCSAVMHEHVGHYDGLADAWARFWQEVEKQGILVQMPCWDAYVTDPADEPDSSKWVTQLYIPLRKID